ncbi:MAG: hypothetical protein JSR25_04845 [Proteobacteria bacterium]|nr:hypothetical protein [Pseudomonadota bacterium]
MAIGRHHPENEGFAASERRGEAVFIALLVCVLLAVVAATIVTVNGSNRRGGPLMARSDILYPMGK